MVNVKCPCCEYETGESADSIIAVALLNAHVAGTHSNSSPSQARRAPKVDRPTLKDNVTEETWNAVIQSWEIFVRGNGIETNDQTVQLYTCCDTVLKTKLTAMNPNILQEPVEHVLGVLKTISVIPVAITVKRNELFQMHQDAGESIQSFLLRVKGKAITCRLQKECTHPHVDSNGQPTTAHILVDFSDEWIRHIILNGMYDDEIRRDVFGHSNLDKMDIDSLITLIEGKETARNATSASSVNSVSQYKRGVQAPMKLGDKIQKGTCQKCGASMKLFKRMSNGKYNKTAFSHCQDCWKQSQQHGRKNSLPDQKADASAITFDCSIVSTVEPDMDEGVVKVYSSKFYDESLAAPTDIQSPTHDCEEVNSPYATGFNKSESASVKVPISVQHHIFKDDNWKVHLAKPHPTLNLKALTHKDDYDHFGFKHPAMETQDIIAITDSGAQVCLWGWVECMKAGLKQQDLIPTKQKLNGVSKSAIEIYGAVLLRMYGLSSSSGEKCWCRVMVYVSPDVSGFYLSEDAMLQLKVIPESFPNVGSAASVSSEKPCLCLKRTQTPGRPSKLPMKVCVENIPAMEQYLRERYASSTFNPCPHQPIPNIEGPPLRIHVDPKAEPKQAFIPSKVPIHWEEQVSEDIKKDEAMNVIEKVPYGETVQWCHRMVVTRKANGKPRRTIDLSPLNKHCLREVHPIKSPFELAKGIPPNTWRTITDAFNGYHSVPLHPDDRHLTTFSTNQGLYRYLRAPQGFASSGDGYNRRLDEITSDFPRYKRCVDDNCHYDDDQDLELHWWRTIDFLELMGKSGITLNPEKLQFCKKDVDFAGFRLSSTTISPLPKYLDSIRNFPTPKSITDVRAWFGLVNQVSHYAQLRDLIEPFRKFLSPSVKFFWDGDLDRIFNDSKNAIVEMIKSGVEIYDINRMTCLRCDWSKSGIGYYLTQKHCKCESEYPDCCEDGWRITLCGSRFMRKSEERYAPIEGEALAVAWSLEQTKFFTMGCDNLVVVVDHKPLTKVLGDRLLDEIPNPRIFRIKQRTLPWVYQIYWMPGKGNSFSDAISRNPATKEDEETFLALINSKMEDDSYPVQCAILADESSMTVNEAASIKTDFKKISAITWERVQEATFSELEKLMCLIQKGFPTNKNELDEKFTDFWNYRHGLYVIDHVIMFHNRVVIPPSLRQEILTTLHAAHQGSTAMMNTAQSTVFWPGICHDIERERQTCHSCNRNTPSHPRSEPVIPIFPTTPFEAIFTDFFAFEGTNYLIIGDRLSAWTEVYRTKSGTEESGSRGLIQLLKNFFGTFGVPRELSSDGGRQFIADDTQDFLVRWGVQHRLSAAYNPQSNGRAELAVKSTKRLIMDNIGPDGDLNTEKFVRAILIKRNTPDPITKLSSAEVVFGRKLRDAMPRIDKSTNIFYNKTVRPVWSDAWEKKEIALRQRYQGCLQRLSEHSKSLPSLQVGDRVSIQNQTGRQPLKWDRSGVVVELRDFDKYVVKVDGSVRLTLQNRRYLKKIIKMKDYMALPAKKTTPHKIRLQSQTYQAVIFNQNHLLSSLLHNFTFLSLSMSIIFHLLKLKIKFF